MDLQQPNQQRDQQQINQQPIPNIQPPKNIRKIVVLTIIGVLILGSASYGAYYWWPKNNKPVACTQEAKQCPDGSYVGRTGPNCEFAACPNLDNCAKEGERVRESGEGFPANCCSGLKAMYGYAQEDCSAPGVPGDIGTCSNCGNGVCESQNNENKCNCPQDCSSNSTANWQTYRNEEYGFEIIFPKSWADYRSEQKDNSVVFSLRRQKPLIYNDGTKKEYGEVFTVIIHPKTEWEQIKNQEPQLETVIKENNQYVATYVLGQDDSGFMGYPEPVPNQIYKGPYYEVQNLIFSTFKFTK